MDGEKYNNICKDNNVECVNNLSPKSCSVICISDDEDDDCINDLLLRVDKEKYSQEMIHACHQLLLKLDGKLRTEETLQILLAQMKMTQRKIKNPNNSSCLIVQKNGYSDSILKLNATSDETHTKVLINDNTKDTLVSSPKNLFCSTITPLSADAHIPIITVTDEMAKRSLDQLCIMRKTRYRNEVGKGLSDIFNNSTEEALYSNEFVAFVGMEEVVKNLTQSDQESLQSGNKKPAVISIICDQCGIYFELRPMNSRVYNVKGTLCDSCIRNRYLNTVEKKCLDSIRFIIARYLSQEQTLDRDYKEVLENPEKFESFRTKLSTSPANIAHNSQNSSAVTMPLNGHLNPNNIATFALLRTQILTQPIVTLQSRTNVIGTSLLHPSIQNQITKNNVVLPLSSQHASHLEIIDALKTPISTEMLVERLTEQQRKDRSLMMLQQNKATLEAVLKGEGVKIIPPK